MNCNTTLRLGLLSSLVLSTVSVIEVSAQGRGRGLNGDWIVTMDFNGNEFESIVAFSRDQDRNTTGQWIGFFGVSELKDIVYADGDLSFSYSRENWNGDLVTSKFAGRVEDGVLTGTLSGERGDSEVKGARAPRLSRAVGNWALSFNVGDRDVTATLVVKPAGEDEFSAEWISEWGEHKISDVAYDLGEFSFKRDSTFNGNAFSSTFESEIDRQTDELSGTIRSEMGDMAVTGKRIGGELIGRWNLDVETEQRGTIKQRLSVNPDLTGRYGALPVDGIKLEDGKVTFPIVMEFGDQTFEMDFAGTLEGTSLNGEITSDRGTQKVTGTKVAAAFRGRR